MPKLNPIIALVGPSGCGKSALIQEMTRRMPDTLAIIKSITTRPRRDDSDDDHYRFVSPVQFAAIGAFGAMIQSVRFSGACYGNAIQDVDPLLETHVGITALVEDAVKHFRNAGYEVLMIRVIPDGPGYVGRGPERAAADQARMLRGPSADRAMTNRFYPGGFETSCKFLEFQIRDLLSE